MNKIDRSEYMRQYYAKNKEKMNKDTAIRRSLDKKTYLTYQYKYIRQRLKTDIQFKLVNLLRKRLSKAIHNKSVGTLNLLGCSSDQLKAHLESKFQTGMNWQNYGTKGWHVDHIIPLASAKTKEEAEKLCHYTNLQPLWAKENLQKGSKVTILIAELN